MIEVIKRATPEVIARLASEKKAMDIVILKMAEVSLVTDYFIICSSNSTTQVRAIVDHVEEKLSEAGVEPLHKEGYREGRWILLDYSECILHVFVEEDRRFYNLEQLWGDAEALPYKE
ncbi:ribosome silencing factor [Anaeromusa acidaminophila]|uniref:ribosome silencing factor n=1 Tax=Anaeromusa acidaminophila TaxID=81464 RepID=UPI00037F0880|nr:ribosome silencing factor [Anaeromusa acidaminophila]